MRYRCPVCMFPSLRYPPSNYHICPCCSIEFGNDDADFSHHQLREMWIANGANWFFGAPPEYWNPWMQLIDAGLGAYIPQPYRRLRIESDAVETAKVRAYEPEFSQGLSPYSVVAA